MARLRAEMDRSDMTKAAASAAVLFVRATEPAPAPAAPPGGPTILTAKLDARCWALWDFRMQQERQAGKCVTCRDGMVDALDKLLGRAA